VQLAADTCETLHEKVENSLPVNWGTQMLVWNGEEMRRDSELADLGLSDNCTIYLIRRPVPVNILLRGWTAENIAPLESPKEPVADTQFEMRVHLRHQYIRTEGPMPVQEFTPISANLLEEVHSEVSGRYAINRSNQSLEALYCPSDDERMKQLQDLLEACDASNDTEGMADAQDQIDSLTVEIEGHHDLLYEALGECGDKEHYLGMLDGELSFNDYLLAEHHNILITTAAVVEEPPSEEEPEPEPEEFVGEPYVVWKPPPLRLIPDGDNAGAACVKARHSETLELPRFEPLPVWSGEEVVAYGNLNAGKWEEDLAANPRDAYAMRRLGRSYLACGDTAKAIELFGKAVVEDPEYAYAKRDLAMAHACNGENREALKLLRQVLVDHDERYAQAWVDIGDILASEGDWDGARTHYNRALDLDLDHNLTATATAVPTTTGKAAALRGLGCCECACQRPEQGRQLMEQALRLAPADHQTRQLLGVSDGFFRQLGDEDWRKHARLAMISGEMLAADPTKASLAANVYNASIRGKKEAPTEGELLRLGAALYMKQASVHAPDTNLF